MLDSGGQLTSLGLRVATSVLYHQRLIRKSSSVQQDSRTEAMLTIFDIAVIMQVRFVAQSLSIHTSHDSGGLSFASTKCQLPVYLPAAVFLNSSAHIAASEMSSPPSNSVAYRFPFSVKCFSARYAIVR
jgi:hypothetical protein